jgi:translation elongation factor EF-Tu-like GTPase
MKHILMHVDECHSLGESGIIIAGKLANGTLQNGALIRLVKNERQFDSQVTKLQIFRKEDTTARPGDQVSFLISPEAGKDWVGAEVLAIG